MVLLATVLTSALLRSTSFLPCMAHWHQSFLLGDMRSGTERRRPPHHSNSTAPLVQLPFTCGGNERRSICPAPPAPPPPSPPAGGGPAPPSCPDYFRYIHDDLRPWRGAGITREAVESARQHAFFRLVVVGGRAYVETYRRAFQTRDVFTQWGILQMLRRYAGRVPDLDIMFACDDPGQVRAADFPTPSQAPPVFRYCKDKSTLDIVFPDWSFWGWPEVNIRSWTPILEEVSQENQRLPWPERQPYAFWKGSPSRYRIRHQLMSCNVSNGQEWNVRVFSVVRLYITALKTTTLISFSLPILFLLCCRTGTKPSGLGSKIPVPAYQSNAYTGRYTCGTF
jgi:hypothetical protein